MMNPQVPTGFEIAHAEWLRAGAENFRATYRFGPSPEFYRSPYWKLVREAVLSSKGFKCCRCNGNAIQVHHLTYAYSGEDHFHPETLVAICRPCHGLVEYARNAEALVSRIRRRISLCNGFLDNKGGCRDQDAAHIYARLLEYRDELAELRNLFLAKTHYNNPRIKSRAESDAIVSRFQKKSEAYQQKAEIVVSRWNGSEREKAERLLPELELEIQECNKFVLEVFAPVSRACDQKPDAPL